MVLRNYRKIMTPRNLQAPQICHDMRAPLCAGVNPSKQHSKLVEEEEEGDSNTARARLGRRFKNDMQHHHQHTGRTRKNATIPSF